MESSGRTIWPSLRPSGIIDELLARQLQPRVLANVGGGDREPLARIPARASMHWDADAGAFEAVEFAGVFEQRGVAALAHVGKNRRDNALGVFQAQRLSLDERTRFPLVEDPDHIG